MSARVTFDGTGYARLTFSYHPWVVEQIKERIPVSARAYDPSTKRWTIAPSWSSIAIGLLRSAFDGEVEIDLGSEHRPEPTPIRVTDQLYKTLHLLPSAPPEVVSAAYKALARTNHPDMGGDTKTMQRLNAAFDGLKALGAA